ncbi:hypothetical protein MCEMRE226_00392 [Candidatus Nanopelagicaceae bacterium]|jgi:hypothetical protein
MRGYAAMTAQEVSDFASSETLDISDIYAPTATFLAAHPDLDEEEIEFTLSMVAAEDALEMKSDGSGAACVLAFEIPQQLISENHEMSVSLSSSLSWNDLQCLFEVSADGEELTWFATQEISQNISTWLKQA